MAHAGRPHWGTMHYRDAASSGGAHPHVDDSPAVRDRLDPARLFTNLDLDRVPGV